VSQPRRWWQDVLPGDWIVFSLPDDLVRERYTALLAALEELSTRGPMSTLADILAQLRSVGFYDPLDETELRSAWMARWAPRLMTVSRHKNRPPISDSHSQKAASFVVLALVARAPSMQVPDRSRTRRIRLGAAVVGGVDERVGGRRRRSSGGPRRTTELGGSRRGRGSARRGLRRGHRQRRRRDRPGTRSDERRGRDRRGWSGSSL
jgi:hypothetical protein